MFVPNIEKVAKLEQEIQQRKELIKRMKSEDRTAARKAEAKRKIELGGVIDMIDKINAGQYPALALDVSLLIGALTNDMIMKRITAQADFLRVEGDKRTNERQGRGKK